jgi:hypothetical protein
VRLPDGQTYSFLSPLKVRVPCSSKNVVQGLRVDVAAGAHTVVIDNHSVDLIGGGGGELPRIAQGAWDRCSLALSPRLDLGLLQQETSVLQPRSAGAPAGREWDHELPDVADPVRRECVREEERAKAARRREFSQVMA